MSDIVPTGAAMPSLQCAAPVAARRAEERRSHRRILFKTLEGNHLRPRKHFSSERSYIDSYPLQGSARLFLALAEGNELHSELWCWHFLQNIANRRAPSCAIIRAAYKRFSHSRLSDGACDQSFPSVFSDAT
jgi:hypothetical protein